MVKVSIDQLSNEIEQALKEYTKEVEQGLEKAQKKVASEGAKKLKATSPKRTGTYAKGWGTKATPTGRVIYNKGKGASITHLLEKGHAKRGGGRVAAIVHIKPVEQEVIEKYIKETERVIRNG